MKSETTLLEIYKWLSEGKKIRRKDFDDAYYLHVVNGTIIDSYEDEVWYHFVNPSHWTLYQEPVEKVKWYKVIYKRKDAVRPSYCMMLFKSEDDFFAMNSNLKEDLDFFHMEEVENHLEKV